MSFHQERFWLLSQLDPGSPAYNRAMIVRFTSRPDLNALERTLSEILRRHEALRATFTTIEGRPVQTIAPVRPLQLSVVDLSERSPDERESRVMRLTDEEVRRSFDLAQGPLLRATLFRLDEEDHLLLLVMHHVAFDAWSAKVFGRDFTLLYEAFSAGHPSPLPELPIQYADFAHWQREWLQGEVLQKQLSYWEERLGDASPGLELPTDRPRPAIQTYHGSRKSLALSADLSKALKALGQSEGVTLFMTLLAALATLLYRYTGQEDMTIGIPIAGRTRVETERLIGLFINTLVIRSNLSGNPTFAELSARIRDVALEAYAHQDIPFEKLVQELRPARDPSRTPLFQVMFNFKNLPEEAAEVKNFRIEDLEFDDGTAMFDLGLEIVEKDEGLSCTLRYNTDLFDATTITRMLGHYRTLLEEIAAGSDQRIGELPLLTEAERHQLLVEWNDTRAEYSQGACIHQLFETQAEKTPDAVAVEFEDQQLTYGELNTRANQLAHYLQKLGAGPEMLIGICLHRSLEMVVGLLGILKAGGAYVPLDPTYPQERLAFMLSDSQVPVLLTQEKLVGEFSGGEFSTICLDSQWHVIARESREKPESPVRPENLAYAIYTSGTTGRPKGVLIAHRGLCNLVESHIRNYQTQQGSRVLHLVSFSFDAATAHMFFSLCSGATLYLAKDSLLPGSELVRILRDHSITHAPLPSAVLATVPFAKLPRLKTITVGAGVCPADLVARWAPGRKFLNIYGPTEVTIAATVARCTAGDRRPPIGRPIANTQIYILDGHRQPVPIGVPGELHIGGVGLARGYLNRPELTAEKFIPHPFSDKPGDRLYRTGDLARYLPDGNIDFLGRIDHQVKLRGLRIELEEVEAVLNQHPAVQESVVLMREDAPGDERLVAYVVAIPEKTLESGELRSHLKVKLPEYMVPAAFVMLSTLPLTPSGKVDRGKLPAPDTVRAETKGTAAVPRTPLQIAIAEIWQDALGVEQVGVYDNFFDLGGHSLLAMQVIARLEKKLGVRIDPRELFVQTLGQLASSYKEKIRLARHANGASFPRKIWHVLKRALRRRPRDLDS